MQYCYICHLWLAIESCMCSMMVHIANSVSNTRLCCYAELHACTGSSVICVRILEQSPPLRGPADKTVADCPKSLAGPTLSAALAAGKHMLPATTHLQLSCSHAQQGECASARSQSARSSSPVYTQHQARDASRDRSSTLAAHSQPKAKLFIHWMMSKDARERASVLPNVYSCCQVGPLSSRVSGRAQTDETCRHCSRRSCQ